MWGCQIAQHTVENHIKHFHGEVESKPIILNRYKGKEGTFIKKFLIGEEFNMNRWRVTWDAIKLDLKSFLGKPLVLTPNRDHPRVRVQEDFRVGDIIDVGLDELKRTAWQVSHVTNANAIQLIRDEKVKWGSPTVLQFSKDTTERINLGNGKIETTLHRFKGAQDALVGNPAYGKDVDFIPAICDGTGEGCALKLMEVSANVRNNDPLSMNYEKMNRIELKGVINSDNIDQVTIVPFVTKSLKKHYKSETINDIVGYIKQADASVLHDCVSRKIKIISDENPSMPNDQVVAVAYSHCRKKKEGEIEDLIAEDIGNTIFLIKDKIKEEIELKNELLHKISDTKSKLKQLIS